MSCTVRRGWGQLKAETGHVGLALGGAATEDFTGILGKAGARAGQRQQRPLSRQIFSGRASLQMRG